MTILAACANPVSGTATPVGSTETAKNVGSITATHEPVVNPQASETDIAAVAESFRAYNRALAEGDTAKACALTASETAQFLTQTSGSCPAALARTLQNLDSQTKSDLANISVGSISIDGDTAAIQNGATRDTLRKVDGKWLLIDSTS
jgi:hypothetical protein